jgi:hypothetical protein
MRRREYITSLAVGTVVSLSGCNTEMGGEEPAVDGELVLDEELSGNGEVSFEASAGNTIHVFVENEGQQDSVVTLAGPDGELNTTEIQGESGFTSTARTAGTHTVTVRQPGETGEVSIEVGIER